MDWFSALATQIGFPLALAVFFIVSTFKLLNAMQATRSEKVRAEAADILADAEIVTNTSKLALEQTRQNATLTEKWEAALNNVNTLGRQVERLTGRVDTLEREGKTKDREIERLQGEVNRLEADLIQVRNDLETSRRENDLLNTVIHQAKQERESLLRQMHALEGQLRLLSERLKQLSTQELLTLSKEVEAIPEEPHETQSLHS